MGPKKIKSTVLSGREEAIVAFRKMTGLPLDDVLYSLQETIPHLSRSSLHRCLKRHGCSVFPKKENSPTANPKKKFKQYPIGYFHIDIAEVRTAEGKLYLYVALDRASKFPFTNHDHHKNAFFHILESVFNEHQIKHRKTKFKHPWTNGQVERMNRTLKEATVKTFYYASHQQLKEHLHDYLMAYNFSKRLKAIKVFAKIFSCQIYPQLVSKSSRLFYCQS
jgi:hypothetical protein